MWLLGRSGKGYLSRLKAAHKVVNNLTLSYMARRGLMRIDGELTHSFGQFAQLHHLEDTLKACMWRRTSISHDKVYGVLGLADDVYAGTSPIDYSMPLA